MVDAADVIDPPALAALAVAGACVAGLAVGMRWVLVGQRRHHPWPRTPATPARERELV